MDEKRRWLALVAALALSIVFYVGIALVFVWRVKGGGGGADLPVLVAPVVAAVCLAASAAAARVAAVPHNPPARFRFLSLVSFLVLDGGALCGVVLTFVTREAWPSLLLAGTALAGIAAFLVPAGNAWFRAREAAPREGAPGPRAPLGPS